MRTTLFVVALLAMAGCANEEVLRERGKIAFDLAEIGTDGLEGEAGAERAVAYEFCLPAKDSYVTQVRVIDPTLQLYPGVPGRVGCKAGEILAIGNTHRAEWRESLARLAALRYVRRIERTRFE
jgi:hypothetical protein